MLVIHFIIIQMLICVNYRYDCWIKYCVYMLNFINKWKIMTYSKKIKSFKSISLYYYSCPLYVLVCFVILYNTFHNCRFLVPWKSIFFSECSLLRMKNKIPLIIMNNTFLYIIYTQLECYFSFLKKKKKTLDQWPISKLMVIEFFTEKNKKKIPEKLWTIIKKL